MAEIHDAAARQSARGWRIMRSMEFLGRSLMIAGAALLVVGLALYLSPSLPLLGRLPGDIRIERPGFRFYFPLTTCLLLSLFLSLCLWVLSKLR